MNRGWGPWSSIPSASVLLPPNANLASARIIAQDYHGNQSASGHFTLTRPGATTVDPRRVGVRPNDVYWGAMGEQIDTRSGNLNFTLPLAQAKLRGGGAVTLGLNYNSQVWRKWGPCDHWTGKCEWKLSSDIGYGFGWRLTAGTITPMWSDYWTLSHYPFTDATGVEWRLDVKNGDLWTTKEDGLYVTYNSQTNRLHFNDGTFWEMGSVAAPGNPAAGMRFPSLIQDSNGNQGMPGWYGGVLKTVEDVRAKLQSTDARLTYETEVLYNSQGNWRIFKLLQKMEKGSNYQFNFNVNQPVVSPFTGQAFGTVDLLTSLELLVGQGTYHFGCNGSGELTEVTFPYGGKIYWEYGNWAYSGGSTLRQVTQRKLYNTTTSRWTSGGRMCNEPSLLDCSAVDQLHGVESSLGRADSSARGYAPPRAHHQAAPAAREDIIKAAAQRLAPCSVRRPFSSHALQSFSSMTGTSRAPAGCDLVTSAGAGGNGFFIASPESGC